VCSTSLRLFRASTQLPNQTNSSGGSGLQQQPLLRAHSSRGAVHQPTGQSLLDVDARSSKHWSVTLRTHSNYDASEVLPRSRFELLDTVSYPGQLFRCIGWSANSARPYLVGGGQASGKLVVVNFAVGGSGSMTTTSGGGSGGGSTNTAQEGGADNTAGRIVKESVTGHARTLHAHRTAPGPTDESRLTPATGFVVLAYVFCFCFALLF
jgi:hypothetical protein